MEAKEEKKKGRKLKFEEEKEEDRVKGQKGRRKGSDKVTSAHANHT